MGFHRHHRSVKKQPVSRSLHGTNSTRSQSSRGSWLGSENVGSKANPQPEMRATPVKTSLPVPGREFVKQRAIDQAGHNFSNVIALAMVHGKQSRQIIFCADRCFGRNSVSIIFHATGWKTPDFGPDFLDTARIIGHRTSAQALRCTCTSGPPISKLVSF